MDTVASYTEISDQWGMPALKPDWSWARCPTPADPRYQLSQGRIHQHRLQKPHLQHIPVDATTLIQLGTGAGSLDQKL